MKILFLDFSTGLKSLADLETGPRRGLTNSLLHLPDVLSKLNNDVWVVSDMPAAGKTAAGTKWIHGGSSIPFSHKWDFLILNRGIGGGYPVVEARHRVLWTHDLPHNGFAEEPVLLESLSAIVFMSVYAKEVWSTFFPQIEGGYIIPNGVDKSLFYPREKDLDYLIYASHPIRGLNRIPLIFSGLKESFPGRPLKMKCFSSVYLGETLKDDHMDKYPILQDQGISPEMEILPAVPVDQLAKELGKAGLMILPTGYPEICSNTILQSLASGTPIVTTGRLGSAGEWINHNWNGAMTRFQPCDYVVHQIEICRLARDILRNPAEHRRWIENAVRTPDIFTWQEIGAKWQKMLLTLS